MVGPGSAYRNKDRPPTVGRRLAELAARQHGVVSSAQLRSLGLDRFDVRRRVQAGALHRLHRGVYAIGHSSISLRGKYMAAVLACGPGAALSHLSAADLSGLLATDSRIAVTVLRTRGGPPELEVHTSRCLLPEDIVQRNGIRVTSVPRTLLDIATVVTPRKLARAVDRAERQGSFDLYAMDRLLLRARGHHGAGALREAISDWRPRRTRRELEHRFQALVEASALRSPFFNVLLEGENDVHEVDAVWPACRLVIQLDGFAYHRTRRDRERDAATDADLELVGYRVVRLTWNEVTTHRVRTTRRLRLLISDT